MRNAEHLIHKDGAVSFVIENTWLSRAVVDHGWGNGYVGVSKEHPFFEKSYDDLNELISIHGGLTFSEMEPIEDNDYWVIGFDTCHAWDSEKEHTKEWVIAETERLLSQVLEHLNP